MNMTVYLFTGDKQARYGKEFDAVVRHLHDVEHAVVHVHGEEQRVLIEPELVMHRRQPANHPPPPLGRYLTITKIIIVKTFKCSCLISPILPKMYYGITL